MQQLNSYGQVERGLNRALTAKGREIPPLDVQQPARRGIDLQHDADRIEQGIGHSREVEEIDVFRARPLRGFLMDA
jgi:hypothetical protein